MDSFTNNNYEFTEFELDIASNHFDDFIFQDASDMTQFEQFDFDPKFRSIQAADPQTVSSFGPPIFSKYEPIQSSSSSLRAAPLQDLATSTKFQIQIESPNITVPEKPFYMGPTHFLTTLCLTELVSRIDQQLGLFFEASFNFFPDHCRWEIVSLRGSSRSKFEICVFRENSESYVVEGNRLSGDSAPFHNLYNKVQCAITNSEPKQRTRPTGSMDCIPLPAAEQLPLEEAINALKPILAMATSPHLDSRVEAVKMICDLSSQMDLQSSLCAAGGIEILMELMTIDYGYCNQYAMCALANLSSSRSCQEVLLKGGCQFFQNLLGMITDGSYQTAEMRREGARTLANLCCSHSKKIISAVGMDSVSSWISGVDDLQDERLKLHARRAQMNMAACM
jgi:hypothetical protein